MLPISMVSNGFLSLGFEVWWGVARMLVGQVPVRSRGSGVSELLGLLGLVAGTETCVVGLATSLSSTCLVVPLFAVV